MLTLFQKIQLLPLVNHACLVVLRTKEVFVATRVQLDTRRLMEMVLIQRRTRAQYVMLGNGLLVPIKHNVLIVQKDFFRLTHHREVVKPARKEGTTINWRVLASVMIPVTSVPMERIRQRRV